MYVRLSPETQASAMGATDGDWAFIAEEGSSRRKASKPGDGAKEKRAAKGKRAANERQPPGAPQKRAKKRAKRASPWHVDARDWEEHDRQVAQVVARRNDAAWSSDEHNRAATNARLQHEWGEQREDWAREQLDE